MSLFYFVVAHVASAYLALTTTLDVFPEFDGTQMITGTVSVSVTASNTLMVTYNLAGLEVSTNGGIHIHSGYSCSDTTLVGSHHFGGSVSSDPWITQDPTWWESGADGNSQTSFTIDSGLNTMSDNVGRTVVVHLNDGTKAACGVLRALDTLVATIGDYADYTGTQAITGHLVVSDDGGSQLKIGYQLTGLEASTFGGVHIHAGMSCADVGAHYWDDQSGTVDDMWCSSPANCTTAWNSDSSGEAKTSFVLDTGFNNLAENINHAVVVHLNDGTKAACGTLSPLPALGVTMGAYPVAVSREITGDILVHVDSSNQLVFELSLFGLEPNAKGGIHIHTGHTCDDATQVGGHYWNSAVHVDDTWDSATLTFWESDSFGRARSNFLPGSGYETVVENFGRAVVVHLADGTRAGCGLLNVLPTNMYASLSNYPDYTPSSVRTTVAGSVTVASQSAGNLKFSTSLTGLISLESGGEHIHVGYACDNATEVGGHYYDTTNTAQFSVDGVDPWNAIFWNASGNADTVDQARYVDSGYNSWADNFGRSVVIHDSSGTRVSCGVLTFTSPTAANPTASPTAASDPQSGGSELSTGAWIGVFGGILGVSVVLVIIYYMFCKPKALTGSSASNDVELGVN